MLRVLVADDSATARLLIVSLLSSDPAIQVVGQAKNGQEAVELADKLLPDVITMDIQMPVMDGLEATRQIVARRSTPVIMVSTLDPAEVGRSMLAYNAGALAVLAKPAGPGTPRFEQDCRELIATVKALSEEKHDAPPINLQPPPAPVTPSRAVQIVGLVASTGGPIALRAFYKALPAKFEPPILIVQHIASGFSDAFASWLSTATGRTVKLVSNGEVLQPGVTYVMPEDKRLELSGQVVTLRDLEGATPGSAMLDALARAFGAHAAGAVLSGIGNDGVAGLRALRDQGGTVFVQEEKSCTAAEAPRAALAAGAADRSTPVVDIAHRIAQLATGKR